MLDKIQKKYKIDIKSIRIILFLLFFVFMMCVIFYAGGSFKDNTKKDVNKEEIIRLFDMISDNYSLEIEKKVNGNVENIVYYKTSNAEMYELDDYLYFVYKNKTYKIGINDGKIKKINDELYFTNDELSNFELIKSLIKYCEFSYINDVKANCKIKYSDYLKEYNLKYNTDYVLNYDNIMSFDIVYYSDGLGKVIIDYTNINQVIHYDNSDIVYGIRVKDVNSNDFSIIFDNYKDIIKK